MNSCSRIRNLNLIALQSARHFGTPTLRIHQKPVKKHLKTDLFNNTLQSFRTTNIDFNSKFSSLMNSKDNTYEKSSLQTHLILQQERKEIRLPRQLYKQFLQNDFGGKVMLSNWNGHQIIYIGAQFDYISPVNIYKILSYCKPSIIMLSMSPDQKLNQFSQELNLRLKQNIDNKLNQINNSQTNFDLIDWLNKITIRQGERLIVDQKLQKNVRHSLKFEGKILQVLADNQTALTRGRKKSTSLNKLNKQSSTVIPNQRKYDFSFGRLNIQTLTTIGIWQNNRFKLNAVQIPIILSQLPASLYNYNLINTLSLTEFQQMAKNGSLLIGKNPDYFPRSPIGGAYHSYSQIVLGVNDQYQGAILRSLCAQSDLQAGNGQKQKILVFTGYGQSSSLPFYLHENTKDLEDCLKVKRTFQTFASKDSIVLQVQKLACLDAMKQWNYKMNDSNYKQERIISQSSKIILDSLIQKYDRNSQGLWASIYGQMKLKYMKIINEHYNKGQLELKDFMNLMAFQNQNNSSSI